MPSKTHPPDSGAPPKTALYCPDCGHDSPIGGDWRIERGENDSERTVYRCPDCSVVIANRPRKLVSP
jgi:DNA-directed RNA polymerase subunit RPC12/RpoP